MPHVQNFLKIARFTILPPAVHAAGRLKGEVFPFDVGAIYTEISPLPQQNCLFGLLVPPISVMIF